MHFSNPDENIKQLGLRPGEKVVIFGSGAGGHTLAAARALAGSGIVYGIDARGQMVEKLKKEVSERRHLNVRILPGKVDTYGGTGVHPGTTDAVAIPDTLFSHQNKEAIFQEAMRILKPGGRVLVVDWKASYKGAGPQPEHVFSEEEALAMAKKTGFEYLKKFSAGQYHYALIFLKPREDRSRMLRSPSPLA